MGCAGRSVAKPVFVNDYQKGAAAIVEFKEALELFFH
jgi:hypothetical protein